MCVFCKIAKGEIPSNKVLESDDFICFHDLNPRAPIHLLIIPKIHVENFQEMPSQLMGEMTSFIQEVASKMGLDQSGYRLITNNGEDGGQEVMHLHFHLLGGTKLSWTHFTPDDTHKAL
ncbi:MAG: histidine triad nucleotide-binding protein [Epsilonproteobacteria bacterium]|nr:histidine triad nucleotide-binding protein [Campylobacterota bacterium]